MATEHECCIECPDRSYCSYKDTNPEKCDIVWDEIKNKKIYVTYQDKLYCSYCQNEIIKNVYYEEEGEEGKEKLIICAKCKKFIDTDWRIGNLDPNSSLGLKYITEVLVSKYLGLERCSNITGNLINSYSINAKKKKNKNIRNLNLVNLGKIKVLASTVRRVNEKKYEYLFYQFKFKTNSDNVDTFFCVGFYENRKNVDRVYIIPNSGDIKKLEAISIPRIGESMYNKYRRSIYEKELDDLYHSLKLNDCPVLRKKVKKAKVF